jgi:shikimate kinase
MNPVFLIGYMASGKTTLGKHLAKSLGLQFIDMDTFIENRYRQTISEIFAAKGESGFREVERLVLHEIEGFENVVISTGGGLPCFFDNMDSMLQAGLTVYLQTGAHELASRLAIARQKRPLVKGKSREELEIYVAETLSHREPFYLRADIIFDCKNLFAQGQFELKTDELKELIWKHKKTN